MAGTRKWRTEEILWILAQYRAGQNRTQILKDFHDRFPDVAHRVDAQSIRYAISNFKNHPEFNQEWDPEQIAFILGRKDAGLSDDDIVIEVKLHWPHYAWATGIPHVQCMEFVVAKFKDDPEYQRGWTQEEFDFVNSLRGHYIDEDIVLLAHEKWPDANILLNDVQYALARCQIDDRSPYASPYNGRRNRHVTGNYLNSSNSTSAASRQLFSAAGTRDNLAPTYGAEYASFLQSHAIPPTIYPQQHQLQIYNDLFASFDSLPAPAPSYPSPAIPLSGSHLRSQLHDNPNFDTNLHAYEASLEREKAYCMLVSRSHPPSPMVSPDPDLHLNVNLDLNPHEMGLPHPRARVQVPRFLNPSSPIPVPSLLNTVIQPGLDNETSTAETTVSEGAGWKGKGREIDHKEEKEEKEEKREIEFFPSECCPEHEAYECWIGPYVKDESSAGVERDK